VKANPENYGIFNALRLLPVLFEHSHRITVQFSTTLLLKSEPFQQPLCQFALAGKVKPSHFCNHLSEH
jgi:hypothetical protein